MAMPLHSDKLDYDAFGMGIIGYSVAEAHEIFRRSGLEIPSGVPEQETSAVTGTPRHNCAHRGLYIDTGSCDLCGIRGQPFEILACAIHGRCSLNRQHSQVKSCAACDDYREIPDSLTSP